MEKKTYPLFIHLRKNDNVLSVRTLYETEPGSSLSTRLPCETISTTGLNHVENECSNGQWRLVEWVVLGTRRNIFINSRSKRARAKDILSALGIAQESDSTKETKRKIQSIVPSLVQDSRFSHFGHLCPRGPIVSAAGVIFLTLNTKSSQTCSAKFFKLLYQIDSLLENMKCDLLKNWMCVWLIRRAQSEERALTKKRKNIMAEHPVITYKDPDGEVEILSNPSKYISILTELPTKCELCLETDVCSSFLQCHSLVMEGIDCGKFCNSKSHIGPNGCTSPRLSLRETKYLAMDPNTPWFCRICLKHHLAILEQFSFETCTLNSYVDEKSLCLNILLHIVHFLNAGSLFLPNRTTQTSRHQSDVSPSCLRDVMRKILQDEYYVDTIVKEFRDDVFAILDTAAVSQNQKCFEDIREFCTSRISRCSLTKETIFLENAQFKRFVESSMTQTAPQEYIPLEYFMYYLKRFSKNAGKQIPSWDSIESFVKDDHLQVNLTKVESLRYPRLTPPEMMCRVKNVFVHGLDVTTSPLNSCKTKRNKSKK